MILAACSCAVLAAEVMPPDSLPKKEIAPLVTFIELGSVGCIPCVKMQPIMKAIEKRYGDQVKVVFYDVRRPENKQYAVEYRVQAIPTQVFLDKKGASFFRHMGFFPEEEIDKLLQKKGLKPVKASEEKS
jgi:thioredoxin 1